MSSHSNAVVAVAAVNVLCVGLLVIAHAYLSSEKASLQKACCFTLCLLMFLVSIIIWLVKKNLLAYLWMIELPGMFGVLVQVRTIVLHAEHQTFHKLNSKH